MLGLYGLGTAVAGVVFACGVLFNKVNNHDKRLDNGDKRLKEHGEAVAGINTSINHIEGDITEIKSDVKTLLRNGDKK